MPAWHNSVGMALKPLAAGIALLARAEHQMSVSSIAPGAGKG
jgi:hypothetical protein